MKLKSFLHRVFFIILFIPLGFFLIYELIIRFFISVIKWVIFGYFDEDFIEDNFAFRLMEFLINFK